MPREMTVEYRMMTFYDIFLYGFGNNTELYYALFFYTHLHRHASAITIFNIIDFTSRHRRKHYPSKKTHQNSILHVSPSPQHHDNRRQEGIFYAGSNFRIIQSNKNNYKATVTCLRVYLAVGKNHRCFS